MSTSGGERPVLFVGVGASAGGLEALRTFFANTEPDGSTCYIVVQHLAPDRVSLVPELLQLATQLHVRPAADRVRPRADTIYIAPPGSILGFEGQCFKLHARGGGHSLDAIDSFLGHLAEVHGPRSVAVIFSGCGSDGAEGALQVRRSGGRVLVQDPNSARFDSMPNAAIERSEAEFVGRPEQLAAHLRSTVPRPSSGVDDSDLLRVIDLLSQKGAVELGGFKRDGLRRRLIAYEQSCGRTVEQILEAADSDAGQLDQLISALMIRVTEFFRDPDAFESLATAALAPLMREQQQGGEIRIWVVGCSSGQEAYSLAIVFDELITKHGLDTTFTIFATDVNPQAIAYATLGRYTSTDMQGVSAARRQRYFEGPGASGEYEVKSAIRRRINFSRHDLNADPPFSNIDLVACRNVLIYFGPELQAQAYQTLRYALKPRGLLFLGNSESPVGRAPFDAVVSRHRLYRQLESSSKSDFQLRRQFRTPAPVSRTPVAERRNSESELPGALICQLIPGDWLVIDQVNKIVFMSGKFDRLIELSSGAAPQSVAQVFRGDFSQLVSAGVRQCVNEAAEVEISARIGGSVRRIRVRALADQLHFVVQLMAADSGQGPSETLNISSESAKLLEPLEARIAQLDRELATANWERLAAQEELQRSNEELLSANEELQSVNEELHTVNSELQDKFAALQRTTTDFENLFRMVPSALVYLDAELRVRQFNPAAMEFFPLSRTDLGRHLEHFAPKVTFDFISLARRGLKEAGEITIERQLSDSRLLSVTALPYLNAKGKGTGVVLSMSCSAASEA